MYIDKDAADRRLTGRVLSVILLTALLAGSVVLGLIHWRSKGFTNREISFANALQAGQYEKAIGFYQEVHEKATSVRLSEQQRALYIDSLSVIDGMLELKISQIQEKLVAGQRLEVADRNFLNGLQDLVASSLVTFVRETAHDYLSGTIEREAMQNVLTQLQSILAIQQGIKQIPAEMWQIQQIRPDVIAANKAIAASDYWTGYEAYEELLNNDELGQFVREQLLSMQAKCRLEMFEPLYSQAQELLLGGRYISADAALNKLKSVYPTDARVNEALSRCAPFVPDLLLPYYGPVEFISVKPLIILPEIAFDGDNYAEAAFDSMLTTTEFERMLSALYDNDYILIDSDRLYDQAGRVRDLNLPAGKKPLVLVVEGLNYYVTRRETGNAWNLVFDQDHKVACEYYTPDGQRVVARDGEAIGILDLFVEEHPDFALDGAKGTISLTGYECIFGYVTDEYQLAERNLALSEHNYAPLELTAADFEKNSRQVAQLIEQLSGHGWTFASSTYGFVEANNLSLEQIKADTKKWQERVGIFTGPVSMLNYPNGSFIQGSDERAEYLKDQGFILFSGIGAFHYLYAGERYIYVDKATVNGYTLLHSQTYQLDRFFQAEAIIDLEARK